MDHARGNSRKSALPRALRAFLLTTFVANLAALSCELVARFVLHLGWPYKSPVLFERTGVDLFAFDEDFQHIHSAKFFDPHWRSPFNYPWPMAPLYRLIVHLPHRVLVFQAFVMILAVCAVTCFALLLHRRTGLNARACALQAAGALLLSYPLAFELRQGNLEIVIVVLVGAGVAAFLRRQHQLSGILFGLALSMKIFPFVYLGLLLARRRWTAIWTAICTAAVATLAAMYYTCPDLSVAVRGLAAGTQLFQRILVFQVVPQTGFDHSAFTLIKVFLNSAAHSFWARNTATILHWYLLIAALTGLVAYFAFIRNLPMINQILCLCIASILLPQVSFDYTLQHLYVPAALLAFYAVRRAQQPTRGLVSVWVCLGILTSVETEFIFHGHALGGQIKAVTLIVLFILALSYPFPYEPFDSSSTHTLEAGARI